MFELLKNILRSVIVSVLEEDDYPTLMEDVEPSVLKVKSLYDNSDIPVRGYGLAAGFDLCAHSYSLLEDVVQKEKLDKDHHLIIPARTRCLVKTGIAVKIPANCYGRIAPRSGLAISKGIIIMAGVIDADYRGEVGVIIFNSGNESFEVRKGDRIAQLICERIIYPKIEEVDNLDETNRGDKGFGSTGIN